MVLSYVELKTELDLRDDPFRPHKGIFIGNDLQFAGVPVTPNFRSGAPLFPIDLRMQPEVRGYIPINIPVRRTTLAMKFTTGFLFPADYGGSFQSGQEPLDPDDAQLVFFRGFFSGGPNSNRGYPFRGVGSRGPIPYFIPGISPTQSPAATSAYCNVADPLLRAQRQDLLGCNFPTGGLTLWEASLELRVPLAFKGNLSGVLFLDASDVSRYRFDVRLLYPHLSIGAGVHYNTEVGPIRLDFGIPIPGAQVFDKSASEAEKTAPSWYAISLGIGEAF